MLCVILRVYWTTLTFHRIELSSAVWKRFPVYHGMPCCGTCRLLQFFYFFIFLFFAFSVTAEGRTETWSANDIMDTVYEGSCGRFGDDHAVHLIGHQRGGFPLFALSLNSPPPYGNSAVLIENRPFPSAPLFLRLPRCRRLESYTK